MFYWAKLAISDVICTTPFLDLWERWRGGHIAILAYHRVLPTGVSYLRRQMAISEVRFSQQMAYLARHYRVISLQEVPSLLKEKKAIPPKTVAITFDDGYSDNYHVAYPILKRLGLPATIFLATDFVGGDKIPWWDELILLLEDPPEDLEKVKLAPSLYPAEIHQCLRKIHRSQRVANSPWISHLITLLNHMPTGQREKILIDLKRVLGMARFSGKNLMLSWDQVQEMSKHGILFGAHTQSHAFLDELSEEGAFREMARSKEIIEEKTGKGVEAFSYPKGRVSPGIQELACRLFSVACTAKVGINGSEQDPYLLKRIDVGECHGWMGGFSESLFVFTVSGMKETIREVVNVGGSRSKGIRGEGCVG